MTRRWTDTPGKILIVDDDLAVRVLLEAVLRRLGHDVTVVGDALDAIDLTDTLQFEVVWMDLMLEGSEPITGYDVIRHVKMFSDKCRFAEIIVSTAGGPRALNRIPDAFNVFPLLKPFDLDEFIDILANALSRARAVRSA